MGTVFWDPVPWGSPDDIAASDGEGLLTMPNPWDVVTLNKQPLPGICSVKTCEATLSIEKKKPPGVDGATITANGYFPGPITVECVVWTPLQWRRLEQMIATFWRPANKDTGTPPDTRNKKSAPLPRAATAYELAIDIYHPALALLRIRSVVLKAISAPEPGPAVGSKLVRFKFEEYVPAPKVPKDRTKTAGKKAPVNPAFQEGYGVSLPDGTRVTYENAAGSPPSATDTGPAGPTSGGVRGSY